MLFAYQRLLSSQGFLPDTCETAEEADRLLMQHPYDAVIADLRLRGHDTLEGLAILQQVHRRTPDTATFLVTGHGSPETCQAVKQIGGIYLEKPVDPVTVIALLRCRINV